MVSKVRANGFENFGEKDGQLEIFKSSQLKKGRGFSEIVKSVGEDGFCLGGEEYLG